MIKTLLFSLLSVASMQIFAQVNYKTDPNAQLRNVSGSFSAISVSSGVTVYLMAADSEEVRISVSDPKKAEAIKTKVKNNVLKITYNYNWIKRIKSNSEKIIVYVNYKAINKISARSFSIVQFTNPLNASSIALNLGSGAICKGQIIVESFALDAGSGAVVDISGTANSANISMGTGAAFKNYNFKANDAVVKLNTGATCAITVNNNLTAKVNTGASLNYKGTATSTNVTKGTRRTVRKVEGK